MRRLLFQGIARRPLTEAPPLPDGAALKELADRIHAVSARRLGRSLAIRQVDAGSCNGCELEIHALNNAFYDLERFGLSFVASPRHADVLLVTGPVTRNMREALERTYNATPDPKWVVAVGNCAFDGGIFAGSFAVTGGVSVVLRVDLHIKGCPPTPMALLTGLLALLEGSSPRAQVVERSIRDQTPPPRQPS
jgi:Ni,Fe-hydrogenase III small subunit